MVYLKHDLFIDVSQNNYTLMLDKHKLDKNGNAVYEPLGYFCTLAGAVHGARDYCIKKRLGDVALELRGAIEEILRIDMEFYKMLRGEMGDGIDA